MAFRGHHWVDPPILGPRAATGGGTTTKSLAGSLTPSGALGKADSKPLIGAATTGGALTRATAKPRTGSVTLTGLLTRAAAKGLTGALTLTGARTKAVAKALAGSVTLSATFAKGSVIIKALVGAVTLSGAAVSKATAKTVTGTVTAGGAVVKAIGKAITGLLSLLGAFSTLATAPAAPAVGGGTFRRPAWSWLRAAARPGWSWNRVARYTVPNTMPVTTLTKPEGEDRDFLFDFSKAPEIVGGLTIESAEVLGGDGLTLGTATITTDVQDRIPAGQAVSLEVSGGSDETAYALAVRVTLDNGRRLIIPARVVVTGNYE